MIWLGVPNKPTSSLFLHLKENQRRMVKEEREKEEREKEERGNDLVGSIQQTDFLFPLSNFLFYNFSSSLRRSERIEANFSAPLS